MLILRVFRRFVRVRELWATQRKGIAQDMTTSLSRIRLDHSCRYIANFSSSHHTITRSLITRKVRERRATGAGGDVSEKPSTDLLPVLPPKLVNRIELRPCRPEDCGILLKYLQAFAEREGYRDKVEITEEELIRDGFGEFPFFRCALAEAHGDDGVNSIVGYALYTYCFCAWQGRTLQWEDMFIHPLYREFGVGSILFHEIGQIAYDQGCRRVSGYVDANNSLLVQWYEGLGYENFTRRFGYHIYSASGDTLKDIIETTRPNEKAKSLGVQVDSNLKAK